MFYVCTLQFYRAIYLLQWGVSKLEKTLFKFLCGVFKRKKTLFKSKKFAGPKTLRQIFEQVVQISKCPRDRKFRLKLMKQKLEND